MGFFNEFPHTRTYDNDLGWLIKTVKELNIQLQNFIKLNTVKYADPIQWNISTQYEANTVVIDELTGVAYISTQPVPSGVNINNTDYWTPVFTLDLVNLNKNITLRNDGDNHTATFESTVGDWVIVGGQLYRVTQDIGLHTAYVVGFNIEIYTVELFIKDYIEVLQSEIGDLQDLDTEDKTSVVNAINSVLSAINTIIGDLQDLDTEDKTSVVNAINSVLSAINTTIGDLDDLTTTDKTSIVNAINSVLSAINTTIGDLDDLTTTDKTSIVNAINSIITDADPDIFVSPKFYGAVGDGVTDDTQAVKDCFANELYIVIDSDFLITDSIDLRNSMIITGAGSIIREAENESALVGNSVENVIIENITFINKARTGIAYTTVNGNIVFVSSSNIRVSGIKNKSHNKMACIALQSSTHFVIENCIIEESGYCGIMCHGDCHYGEIKGNIVEVDNYTGYANTYGIGLTMYPIVGEPSLVYQCTHIKIHDNIVYTKNSFGYWEGIDTHACSNIDICNNQVKGFLVGIRCTRSNSYSDTDMTPKRINISDNHIIGPSSVDSSRTDLVGIEIDGNAGVQSDSIIANNKLESLSVTLNGANVGTGIQINGAGYTVANNEFGYSMEKCINLHLAGYVVLSGNVGYRTVRDFINFDSITGEVAITHNTFMQARNFYSISNNTGLSMVLRHDNEIVNAYWKDNTANVTNLTDFVPDYCNASPAGSNYHPRGMRAIKSTPASGSPEKWVSNGSTWIASANLA